MTYRTSNPQERSVRPKRLAYSPHRPERVSRSLEGELYRGNEVVVSLQVGQWYPVGNKVENGNILGEGGCRMCVRDGCGIRENIEQYFDINVIKISKITF